jgi:competence protein ComEC
MTVRATRPGKSRGFARTLSFALALAAGACSSGGSGSGNEATGGTATGGKRAGGTGGTAPSANGGAGGASAPTEGGSGGVTGAGGTTSPAGSGGAGGATVDAPMDQSAGETAPTPTPTPTDPNATFRIFWIDVEGGAATLLISPTGETLLADTGWGGNRDVGRIAAVLEKETGKKKLDYFVATHYHVDHVGGAGNLARAVEIANFIDHGASVEGGGDFNTYRSAVMTAMGGAKRISVSPGMKFMLGPVEITIVTAGAKVASLPGAAANPACGNATARRDTPDEDPQSVGFLARYGKFEFMDLGDLTAGVEHNLVCPMNQVGQIDLFQVSQHGSGESSPPVLVPSLAPQVVVFNNGASKGGDGAVFERWKSAATTKAVWAVHQKPGQSAAQNADEALTANLAGPDMAHHIRASVKADGSFSVTNGRTNMSREYTAQ